MHRRLERPDLVLFGWVLPLSACKLNIEATYCAYIEVYTAPGPQDMPWRNKQSRQVRVSVEAEPTGRG